jgi:hypothetical protein
MRLNALRLMVGERWRFPIKTLYYELWRLKVSPRRRDQQSQLERILSDNPHVGQVFILAPSIEWDIPLFQRPQQLALALAGLGALVFYVEPAHSPAPLGFFRLMDNLYLARTPMDVFKIGGRYSVFVQAWNQRYLKGLRNPRIIYDYIDDLSVFPFNQAKLRRRHNDLLKNAELVLATSSRLHEEASRERPDCLLCPNGVDYHHFSASMNDGARPPDDLAPIVSTGRPLIGYYGALARWFDFELLREAALSRPNYSFVLIGPDWDGSIRRTALLNVPNVFWLGPKSYWELPKYLRRFDAAMIPFRLNPITHSVSPLKLFEYMAGGKPVVVTAMEESSGYDGVLSAAGPIEFAGQVDAALLIKDDPGFAALIDATARRNTWQTRARSIMEALGTSPIGEPRRPAAPVIPGATARALET